MYLKRLELTNYRNYTRLEIVLPARINVFQGENAQGKTNLLEAIYYLATTRSPIAATDRQLIAWTVENEMIPYARLEGVYDRGGEEHTLEMTLVKEQQPNGSPEQGSLRRQVRLDGSPRRALDIVGRLNVVLFLPENLALVGGAPGERRHYLDVTLCQIDPLYCQALSRYNRVITQRNALLHQIRDRRARSAELGYWDEQLAHLGAQVLARRLWAVGELNRHVAELHPALTGGEECLILSYVNSAVRSRAPGGSADTGGGDSLEIPPLQESLQRALEAARSEEIARGVTIVGPHRDDMRLLANAMDVTTYGSRGQQRTVALALKLAEVALMRDRAGEMPILLLDDALSELDQRRSRYLMQAISRAQQVLITTTDLARYEREFLDTVVLWQVVAGAISPLSAARWP